MKILVTSGGTKIPIDKVRNISNMSKGTFGAKIASELLKLGHEVVFMRAEGSKSPFETTVDMRNTHSTLSIYLRSKIQELELFKDNYTEISYSTFDAYAAELEKVLKYQQIDVALLAAAVSDYGVANFTEGKIRSGNAMTINLVALPKLISKVKEWAPNTQLVGFKLLVDSSEGELEDAAMKSIKNNGCDMVVANDLSEIRRNNHTIHLVFPNKPTETYLTDVNDSSYLARQVAKAATSL